jgi:hypothetical protein
VLVYPQPAYAPPPPTKWRSGDPVPLGYHVEQRPRDALVTAGLVVTLVPYIFSAIGAYAADSKNESGWLYVPFAGPWITIGRRDYSCNPDASNPSTGDSLRCVGDVFLVMALITDGILQAAGGTLLLVGYTVTKPELVRDDAAVRFAPMRIGTGYGAGLLGAF